jgi:hypothetical protein
MMAMLLGERQKNWPELVCMARVKLWAAKLSTRRRIPEGLFNFYLL